MAKKKAPTPRPKRSPGGGTDPKTGRVEKGYQVPKPPKPGPSKSK